MADIKSIKDITTDDFKGFASDKFRALGWCGYELQVRTTLSIMDMLSFVNTVVDSCFADDTGEYRPELADFALRREIVSRYTDMPLPDDLNLTYGILYNTSVVEKIISVIDKKQLEVISNAVSKKIDYRASANIEAVNQKMNEAITEFNELEESLSKLFDGVDNDALSSVITTFASGEFDEKKLLNAAIERQSSHGSVTSSITAADGDA